MRSIVSFLLSGALASLALGAQPYAALAEVRFDFPEPGRAYVGEVFGDVWLGFVGSSGQCSFLKLGDKMLADDVSISGSNSADTILFADTPTHFRLCGESFPFNPPDLNRKHVFVYGKQGDDFIKAPGWIEAGPGDDQIIAVQGFEPATDGVVVYAGRGADVVWSDYRGNVLDGEEGDDTLCAPLSFGRHMKDIAYRCDEDCRNCTEQ